MLPLEFVRWYNSVRGYCTALIDDGVSNRSSGWAIILLSWFCAVYSTENGWVLWFRGRYYKVEFVELRLVPHV